MAKGRSDELIAQHDAEFATRLAGFLSPLSESEREQWWTTPNATLGQGRTPRWALTRFPTSVLAVARWTGEHKVAFPEATVAQLAAVELEPSPEEVAEWEALGLW